MFVCTPRRTAPPSPAVLALPGRILCGDAVRAVRRNLPWLVGDRPRRGLHLDLSAVLAPTAGGLGGLIELDRDLREAGHELVLLEVGPQARGVFRLTGLDARLDVRPRP
jgi:anti-anti-sigma regulatory factor